MACTNAPGGSDAATLPPGTKYVTPSGRDWRLTAPSRWDRRGTRDSILRGPDPHAGGIVGDRHVAIARLDGRYPTWRLA